MTIKEIAELCGVDQSTVNRWIHDPACKMQAGILEKLEKSGHGISADFTLEETLTVIGEGGKNKALASLLAENAANKDALTTQKKPDLIPQAIENAIQMAVEKAIQDKLAFFLLPSARKKAVKLTREEEIRQEVAAFAEKCLEFTENWFNIVKEQDMYVLFKEGCIEKTPIPKYAFHSQLRQDFPQAVFGRNKQDVAIWHNVRLKGA
jgi:hypothetical protein